MQDLWAGGTAVSSTRIGLADGVSKPTGCAAGPPAPGQIAVRVTPAIGGSPIFDAVAALITVIRTEAAGCPRACSEQPGYRLVHCIGHAGVLRHVRQGIATLSLEGAHFAFCLLRGMASAVSSCTLASSVAALTVAWTRRSEAASKAFLAASREALASSASSAFRRDIAKASVSACSASCLATSDARPSDCAREPRLRGVRAAGRSLLGMVKRRCARRVS